MARADEAARQLADIHRTAQERIGLTGALATLDEWQDLNLVRPASGGWFRNLLSRLLGTRSTSRRLAARYYNLSRAITTGRALPQYSETLQDVNEGYGNAVRMDRLFGDFGDTLQEALYQYQRPSTNAPAVQSEAPIRADTLDSRLDALVDTIEEAFKEFEQEYSTEDLVAVDDDFEWPTDTGDDDFIEEFTDIVGEKLDDLEDKIAVMEKAEETDSADVRKLIEEASRATSYEVAGIADQGTIKPGRDVIQLSSAEDDLVVGWMRVTGPHPCAFCAMLAAGGVIYTSQDTAGLTPGQGRVANARARRNGPPPGMTQYHQNCHCSVTPIFTRTPALSKRDQFFSTKFTDVTEGEKDKLNAWRRWLTQQYKAGNVPDQDIYGPAR